MSRALQKNCVLSYLFINEKICGVTERDVSLCSLHSLPVHVVILCFYPIVPDIVVPFDKTSAKWTVLTAPYHVTRSENCAIWLGGARSEMTCDSESYIPPLRSFIEVTEKHPASYFLNPSHLEKTNKRWDDGMKKQFGTTIAEKPCKRLVSLKKAEVSTFSERCLWITCYFENSHRTYYELGGGILSSV
jgi:hypothetical protein